MVYSSIEHIIWMVYTGYSNKRYAFDDIFCLKENHASLMAEMTVGFWEINWIEWVEKNEIEQIKKKNQL